MLKSKTNTKMLNLHPRLDSLGAKSWKSGCINRGNQLVTCREVCLALFKLLLFQTEDDYANSLLQTASRW